MKKPLLIDLYGGPSSGKSTTSLALTALLKLYCDQYACSTLRVEYVSEAAKDHVWESGTLRLKNQARLLGEQYRRLERLREKVDIIVSDSPLWLCEFYAPKHLYPDQPWAEVIRAHYQAFAVLPILVNRVGQFQQVGRVQNEAESAAAHEAIAAIARREYSNALIETTATPRTPYQIIRHLSDRGDIPAELPLMPFARWYADKVMESLNE